MKTHTPGPWHIQDSTTAPCEVLTESGLQIGHVFFTDMEHGSANAYLIAAAPELLAALHDLVRENDAFGGCPQSSPTWTVASAALAKARGQSL